MSVLKLHLNDTVNLLTYNQVHNHVIILSQNSDSLFDILLSAELKLYEKINVIWFDDRFSTAADLKFYLKIQKLVIYQTLQWFQLYNKLYSQIIINQNFLNLWADNFISNDLENSIIQSQDNNKKCKSYVADIEIENCKNNLQETLDN